MMSSLLAWIAPAILLFWCVGAYNRLVRLRGDAKSAFAHVEAELRNHAELAQQLPPEDGVIDEGATDGTPLWTQVRAATVQLTTSLASARNRPLDPQVIAALQSAAEILDMAWDRAEREDVHDLAGPRLPESVYATRAQVVAQVQAAAVQFNDAVARYNHAISQFPAVLLAWLFGFKSARTL